MLLLLTTIANDQQIRPQAGAVDEKLIMRVAQGDKDAFGDLYHQSKAAVYGFALSILRHPSSAEDVMQETYVKIYQAAADYRAQGKPMAWILTITRNLALGKIRTQKGREISLSGVSGATPEVAEGFEQDSLNRLILNTALQSLGAQERQIVILHSVSGLKHREIAALLEIPLSTTLSKYNRALKKLRKIIEEGGARYEQ